MPYERGTRGSWRSGGRTRGRGSSRGRGRGLRHHPYAERAEGGTTGTTHVQFRVNEPNISNYEDRVPDFPDKARLLEAKRREQCSLEGLKLVKANFTWQPNSPMVPGFVHEEELKTALEELRVEYRERCREKIQEHCERHLSNNKQILQEIEEANNIMASETNIMARVKHMVEERMSKLEAMLKSALSSNKE